MSSSELRSACYALRRPPLFPLQNFSMRRFYSADGTAVGKPPAINKATVDARLSRQLDEINRVFDETDALLLKYGDVIVENIQRKRRRKAVARGAIFAGGVLAATYYVKEHFFGGTKEDKEMSTGAKEGKEMSTVNN